MDAGSALVAAVVVGSYLQQGKGYAALLKVSISPLKLLRLLIGLRFIRVLQMLIFVSGIWSILDSTMMLTMSFFARWGCTMWSAWSTFTTRLSMRSVLVGGLC